MLKNRHHKELGLLFNHRDTLHLRLFMEYCSHIRGGAPQSVCLDLLDRVQKRLVNLIGPALSATMQPLSQRSCSKRCSPSTLKCKINSNF